MLQSAPASELTVPRPALDEALVAARPALARFCRRLTSDSAAADDLTQETLLTAWRLRERLTAPEGLGAWLAAIARNHARRLARARNDARARLVPLDEDADADPAFTSGDPDPAAAIEREEDAALARRALALAPAAARDLLTAASARPSANGVTDGAERARLTRARKALRRAISADAELREALVDLSLTLPAHDGWTESRIWCPFCGASYLRYRVDRESGEYAIMCAARCRGGAVAGGARNLDLTRAVNSAKSLISRHCLILETEYRETLARGWDDCPCGGRGSFRTVTPQNAPAGWPVPFGLHGSCPRCGRMDSSTAWHLALDTTDAQRFWRRFPRMRALEMTGVEREGRAAVVTGFEAIGAPARLEIVSDARDYTVLAVALSHAG